MSNLGRLRWVGLDGNTWGGWCERSMRWRWKERGPLKKKNQNFSRPSVEWRRLWPGKDHPKDERDPSKPGFLASSSINVSWWRKLVAASQEQCDGGSLWPLGPGRTPELVVVYISKVTVSSFPKRICYPSTTATNCSSPVTLRAASFDFNYCWWEAVTDIYPKKESIAPEWNIYLKSEWHLW